MSASDESTLAVPMPIPVSEPGPLRGGSTDLKDRSGAPSAACSRRSFLRSTSIVCVGATVLPSSVLTAAGTSAPGSKVTLAGIGVGGVGHGQLQELAKAGFQIVALCDVDDSYARKTFDLW